MKINTTHRDSSNLVSPPTGGGRGGLKLFILVFVVALFSGCSVKYSFTGAQIPIAAQTFSVAYFPNNATLVAPMLSNALTEALRDRMLRQTRLTQVGEAGDLAFEGEITNYATAPSSVSADEYALMNRLTITVTVRFTNLYAPEWNFEQGQTFTAFADYPANQMLSAVEAGLIEEIVEQLVDNIFNASVANW